MAVSLSPSKTTNAAVFLLHEQTSVFVVFVIASNLIEKYFIDMAAVAHKRDAVAAENSLLPAGRLFAQPLPNLVRYAVHRLHAKRYEHHVAFG